MDRTRKEVQEELKSSLGKNEEKAVLTSRISVFLILLLTGVLVSLLVYKFRLDDETSSFEDSFKSNSKQLVDVFHQTVERKLVAIDGLATTVTGTALSHGISFPNVTIPDFAVSLSLIHI